MPITAIVASQNNWSVAYPNPVISLGASKESYTKSTLRYAYKYDSYETSTSKIKYKLKYESSYGPTTALFKFKYLANIVPANTKLSYKFKYRSDRLSKVTSEYILTYDVNLPVETAHKLFYQYSFKTDGTTQSKIITKLKYEVQPVEKAILKYKLAYSTSQTTGARVYPFIVTNDQGLTYDLYVEVYTKDNVDWSLYITNPTRYTLVTTKQTNTPSYVSSVNLALESTYNKYTVPPGLTYRASRKFLNIALDRPLGISLNVDDTTVQYMTFNIGNIGTLSADTVVPNSIYGLQNLPRVPHESVTRLDIQFINNSQCCFSTKYVGAVCSPY